MSELFGKFEDDITDQKIFEMLFTGDVVCFCPYCNKNQVVEPSQEVCICSSCKKNFLSPLYVDDDSLE